MNHDKDRSKMQLAAIRGDARAQYLIAECYRRGMGLPKDDATAFRWCKAAAEQGEPDAQQLLSSMYRGGEGVAVDMEQAVYWCRRAAENGDPMSLYNLGMCYYHGTGVDKDRKAAFAYFSKAAQRGYNDAIGVLGVLYQFGEGVAQDLEAASTFHIVAALQGDINANRSLSEYRVKIERLALAGSQRASLNLAKMCDHGLGVKKDRARALAWLTWAGNNCSPARDGVCGLEVESMTAMLAGALDLQTTKKSTAAYRVLERRKRASLTRHSRSS